MMNHLPSIPAPLGGVFEADPDQPSRAPEGARAIEIRDEAGRLVAYCWVVAERATLLVERGYEWLDLSAPPSLPPLSLLP